MRPDELQEHPESTAGAKPAREAAGPEDARAPFGAARVRREEAEEDTVGEDIRDREREAEGERPPVVRGVE